jgi:hypothetical protein
VSCESNFCVNIFHDNLRRNKEHLFTSIKTYNYLHSAPALKLLFMLSTRFTRISNSRGSSEGSAYWTQNGWKNITDNYWHSSSYRHPDILCYRMARNNVRSDNVWAPRTRTRCWTTDSLYVLKCKRFRKLKVRSCDWIHVILQCNKLSHYLSSAVNLTWCVYL